MRIARLLAVAVIGTGLLAAWALGESGDPRPARPAAPGGGPGRADFYKTILENLTKQLNLSPDQQTQVKEKIDTFQQEMENFRKEAGSGQEFRDRLAKAQQENDTRTIEAIQAQMAERRKKFTEMRAALNEQIAGVLDDKQKEQFAKIVAAGQPGAGQAGGQRSLLSVVDTLPLSAAQRKAITDAIMDILTDEQKETLKKRMAEGAQAPTRRGRPGGPGNRPADQRPVTPSGTD